MAYGEKTPVSQKEQPILAPDESAALAIGEAALHALPSNLRSRLAVQWAMTQQPGHRALAHSMIKLCDLISIDDRYRHEGDTSPMPYVFSKHITDAFFDSPHEGSLDLFFETARQQSRDRLSHAPCTELDPATGLPATLLKEDLGPRLATILLRADTGNAWNLIARPFPLALASQHSTQFGSRPQIWGTQNVDLRFNATPLAVCMAKDGLFEIGRALIERPEVWSLARAAFVGARRTLDTDQEGRSRHMPRAQERVPDGFNFLQKDPSVFAQAWPLVRSMMDKLTPDDINRIRPEWVPHFVLSASAEARQWSREHFSPDVFRFAVDDRMGGNAEKITAFFRCGDSELWSKTIESIGVKHLLGSARDYGTLMMMRAARDLGVEQFKDFATQVARADSNSLLAHLREGCWVIDSNGMRKKGDFLAYCVAANKPEHATVIKDLFPDNSLSTDYARDLIKYCKKKDPVSYGPKVLAAWERLLLDEVLAKARKNQAPKSTPAAQAVAEVGNLPLFSDAAQETPTIPAPAPARRSNRL